MTQTLSPGSSLCHHCSCHFKVSEGQLHGKLCYNPSSCIHSTCYCSSLAQTCLSSWLYCISPWGQHYLSHPSETTSFFSLPSAWHVTIPSTFQYVSKIDPAGIHISPPPLLQPWSEPYLLSSEWCCSLKPDLFLLSFLFLSNPVSTKQQSKLLKP